MALQGRYIKKWQEPSDSKFKEVEVTYPAPDIMSKEDPNYEFAGKTVVIQEPVMEDKETVFDDVYVIIRSYAITKFESDFMDTDGERLGLLKNWTYNMRVSIYESKEARELNPENHIFEENISILIDSLKGDLFEQGYGLLKKEKNFQELTDVI
jgi:hypothetical protein